MKGSFDPKGVAACRLRTTTLGECGMNVWWKITYGLALLICSELYQHPLCHTGEAKNLFAQFNTVRYLNSPNLVLKAWKVLESCWSLFYTRSLENLFLISAETYSSDKYRTDELASRVKVCRLLWSGNPQKVPPTFREVPPISDNLVKKIPHRSAHQLAN